MGTSLSCSFANFDDLESRFEAFFLRSLSFNGEDAKNSLLLRSFSFNGRDSEPATNLLKSYGSAKFVFERSLSLKRKELERMMSLKTPTANMKNAEAFGREEELRAEFRDLSDNMFKEKPSRERNQAALKLQKVYKSFRTRRRLADCAVMVEQRWLVAAKFGYFS